VCCRAAGRGRPTDLDVLLRDAALAAAVASCTAARAACRLVPLPPPSAEPVWAYPAVEWQVSADGLLCACMDAPGLHGTARFDGDLQGS